MIEYRQRVPKDRENDRAYVSMIRVNVAEELSRQASSKDDPDEYFVEALANITERPSTHGGFWVHSYLERDRRAEYLDPIFEPPHKVPVPFAKVHAPVDFTPDELARHMEAKHRG